MKWQPIETAPKDGTLLLVGWLDTWPEKKWKCEVATAGNMIREKGCYLHGRATHWMPLPEPPDCEADK